jgi:phosphate-selective porin OprO and OprP
MKTILTFILIIQCSLVLGQSSNDILNVLIANKTITQQQADSLRAEAAIKQQETESNKKTFGVSASRLIQISAYTQIRYQQLEEKGKKDGFDIRRARLDLTGNLTPFISYRLLTEFAYNPKIMDAYAEIKANDYFNFTIGQFRVPFSYENLIPVRKLDVIDFSQVTEALVFRGGDVIGNQNGRDIGIQLGGTLLKNSSFNVLEYKIGVFNGSGINITDTANKAKDVAFRLIVTPLKGFSIGTSYYNGWGKALKPSSAYLGKSQPHNRFGVDLSYTSSRFAMRGEYIQGTDGEVRKEGWYILAEYYIIRQKLQLVAKYDVYDRDMSKDSNTTTNYVTGLNFNFNSWSRVQAFYTFRDEQTTEVNNNYLSIQFQIGF